MTSRADASPPDAVAPPPGNPRFPLLDSLRAIAALSIVATHTAAVSRFNEENPLGAWTARLDCGVAIFFVLSGFLLYRPFVAARLGARRPPAVARYGRRRALRILPAYWAALIVLGVLEPHWTPGVFGDHWWVYFGLLQSWNPDWIAGGIGVAWSLSVEMAFYVLLPLYALIAARALGGRDRDGQARIELIVLGASAAVALVARILVHSAAPDSVYGNSFPGNWAWFAAGLSLAVASAWLGARPPATWPRLARLPAEHPLACWGAAFAFLTLAAFAIGLPRRLGGEYTSFALQAQHVLYLGVALCLVAPGVLGDGRRTLPVRVLSWPVLAWLGLVSYGIFLYHQPLVVELTEVQTWVPEASWAFYTVLVTVAAAACAATSYYLLERPILRFKEGRPRAAAQRTRTTGGSSARSRARAAAARLRS